MPKMKMNCKKPHINLGTTIAIVTGLLVVAGILIATNSVAKQQGEACQGFAQDFVDGVLKFANSNLITPPLNYTVTAFSPSSNVTTPIQQFRTEDFNTLVTTTILGQPVDVPLQGDSILLTIQPTNVTIPDIYKNFTITGEPYNLGKIRALLGKPAENFINGPLKDFPGQAYDSCSGVVWSQGSVYAALAATAALFAVSLTLIYEQNRQFKKLRREVKDANKNTTPPTPSQMESMSVADGEQTSDDVTFEVDSSCCGVRLS